jgi:hypothetical protein
MIDLIAIPEILLFIPFAAVMSVCGVAYFANGITASETIPDVAKRLIEAQGLDPIDFTHWELLGCYAYETHGRAFELTLNIRHDRVRVHKPCLHAKCDSIKHAAERLGPLLANGACKGIAYPDNPLLRVPEGDQEGSMDAFGAWMAQRAPGVPVQRGLHTMVFDSGVISARIGHMSSSWVKFRHPDAWEVEFDLMRMDIRSTLIKAVEVIAAIQRTHPWAFPPREDGTRPITIAPNGFWVAAQPEVTQ